jgi:sulfate permease, SulP family
VSANNVHVSAGPRPSGLRRYVPILSWLGGYDRSFIRFDVIAGATVWGVAGAGGDRLCGAGGLPPQAGLYTLLAAPVAYAVFGTSRHVVCAGTSAAAVLVASTVVGVGAAGADGYAAEAATMILLCAGLLLVAGLLHLGFVAQLLSRPVVEGFVFGLAIFVTVKQLPKLFGIEPGAGDTIRQVARLLAHLRDTSGATLAVGVGALALLFGAERFWPRLPGGLLVLVLGIAISGCAPP